MKYAHKKMKARLDKDVMLKCCQEADYVFINKLTLSHLKVKSITERDMVVNK